MHRSGTSCLTGALEACGCCLGGVERSDPDNPPGGNIELPAVNRIHDRILADSGGTWYQLPPAVRIRDWHRIVIRDLLTQLRKDGIGAVKDPRMLFVAPVWMSAARVCSMVGTFRHPLAVARSLARRDNMPREEALALWAAYNSRLVSLHQKHQFPLIEYQLNSPARYRQDLMKIISCLGRPCDRSSVDAWVRESYGPDEAAGSVPAECRVIFDYLSRDSVGSLTADSAVRAPALVVAPVTEIGRLPWSESLHLLVYRSVYRSSLIYHRLPLGFRVWARELAGEVAGIGKRSSGQTPDCDHGC